MEYFESREIGRIFILSMSDSEYPEMLQHIKSPPPRLYCAGNLSLLGRRSVAIVGARKVTGYGKWVAYNSAKALARYGIVTVSGMAFGADAQAHLGALENEGDTIAVLGCGVDVCYPAANKKLRDRILEKGLIVSEYEPGKQPFKGCFPMRNRIISGISEAVVVAEAGLGSGSLITAEAGLEQGRQVFAAPANINVISSIGCNKLIKDGATPLVTVEDIIEGLGIAKEPFCDDEEHDIGSSEREVYNVVKRYGEIYIDNLCKELKKTSREVNPILTVLEIKGMVSTFMGKIYIAK